MFFSLRGTWTRHTLEIDYQSEGLSECWCVRTGQAGGLMLGVGMTLAHAQCKVLVLTSE